MQLVAAILDSDILDHLDHGSWSYSSYCESSPLNLITPPPKKNKPHNPDEWMQYSEDNSGAIQGNYLLKIKQPFQSRARITTQTSWLL